MKFESQMRYFWKKCTSALMARLCFYFFLNYYILFLFIAYCRNNSYVAAVSWRAALGRPSNFKCWHHTSLSSHLCNNWQNKRCRGVSWSSTCETLYRWGKIKIKNPEKMIWLARILVFFGYFPSLDRSFRVLLWREKENWPLMVSVCCSYLRKKVEEFFLLLPVFSYIPLSTFCLGQGGNPNSKP